MSVRRNNKTGGGVIREKCSNQSGERKGREDEDGGAIQTPHDPAIRETTPNLLLTLKLPKLTS
jgi:hypothetical protein